MSGAFGSSQWMYSSGASGFYPYLIDQSLRFEETDTPSLSRTQTSGTTTTWTFSAWVKRSRLDSVSQTGGVAGQDPIFCVGDANTDDMLIYFHQHSTADRLDIIIRDSSTIRAQLTTSRRFRDVAAFYHIQVTCDFTNATQGDRLRLYVNGVRETVFDTETYPSDTSQVTVVNNSSYTARIGQLRTAASYFAGYMAEVRLVDGSALEPTSFGEFSNGVWIPVNYSGSHGAAGWYLPFDDGSALGDDESENTNDFSTVVGLAASDVMTGESPTNNFATWNPLDKYNYNPPSEGNLRALTAGNNGTQNSTFAVSSGKWYWEARNITAGSGSVVRFIGIAKEDTSISSTPYTNTDCYLYYAGNGNIYNGSNLGSYGDAWGAIGDIIGVAFDADTGAIWFSKNGTWQNSATAAEIAAGTTTNAAFTGLSGTFVMMVSRTGGTSSNDPHHANFGQDSTFAADATTGSANAADDNGIGDFYYTPPSGFLALCSANLPEPTISPNADEQADDYFNTVLYTGNAPSTQAITCGLKPDFVWIKNRTDASTAHSLFNTIMGAELRLSSSSTTGEQTKIGTVTSFDADGFTTGNNDITNKANSNFVSWNWKAGGTASTIAVDTYSAGVPSITSSVSAAPDAGFSIVSWTGTGATGTIGHGLSSGAPEMIIVKNRDTTGNWHVYHKDTNDAPNDVLFLNLTNADTDQARFNDTTPTASVFSIGSGSAENNLNDEIIAYCFHSVDGYSKVGSYIGNGSADGTFVYTGFRPAFWLMKSVSDATHWVIYDSARETFNAVQDQLLPNEPNAEAASGRPVDFLSNGVKLRFSSYLNDSGQTYIYLAFAEAPFKYANAR